MNTIRDLSPSMNAYIKQKVTFKKAAIKQLFREQKGFCVFCECSTHLSRKKGKRRSNKQLATLEHVTPQSLGGEDLTSNLVMSCADCNNKRGSTDFDEWLVIRRSAGLWRAHLEKMGQKVIDRKENQQKRTQHTIVGLALIMHTYHRVTGQELVLSIPT